MKIFVCRLSLTHFKFILLPHWNIISIHKHNEHWNHYIYHLVQSYYTFFYIFHSVHLIYSLTSYSNIARVLMRQNITTLVLERYILFLKFRHKINSHIFEHYYSILNAGIFTRIRNRWLPLQHISILVISKKFCNCEYPS